MSSSQSCARCSCADGNDPVSKDMQTQTSEEDFVINLFHHLDSEGKGAIALQQIFTRLQEFDTLTAIDQLRYILRVVDSEGGGLIDMDMLRIALESWSHSLQVNIDDDKMDAIAGALFACSSGGLDDTLVTVSEVMMGLQHNPKLLQIFARPTQIANMKSKDPDEKVVIKKRPRFIKPSTRYFSKEYLYYNLRKVIAFLIYLAVNAVLFTYGSYMYRESNWFCILARGCGMALNFNTAFILILILRTMLTYLRGTFLMKILPLDQHILFHRVVGVVIGVLTVIHTFSHIVNVLIVCKDQPPLKIAEYLFLWHSGVGYIGGSAYLTGWLLFILLFLMIFSSMAWVRYRAYKVFYCLHYLAFPFMILCVLHGPNVWKWMLAPGILFTIEKILSSRWWRVLRYGNTCIREAHLLPNGVVHIVMTRPKRFKFQPGDYILIMIPSLSKYEWHPFTISSPPEEEDISCHVRTLGDWTKRLHSFFDNNPDEPTQEYRLQKDGRKRFLSSTESRVRENLHSSFAIVDNESGQQSCIVQVNGLPHVAECSPKRNPLPTGLSALMEEEKYPFGGGSSAEDSDSAMTTKSPLMTSAASKRKLLAQTRRKKRFSRRRSAFQDMTSTQTSFEIIDDEVRVVSKLREDTENLRVYIDGPYGTPTRRVFESDHAVLIAAGIGITPFASVVQSIMHRYRRCKTSCPRCKVSWPIDETLKSTMKLKKVDLIWINRERRNFEWFVSLLSELEAEVEDDAHYHEFMKTHLYMTSEPDESILEEVALQAAVDQLCKRSTKDVITGLKTRTKFGRPNWNQVFSQIRDENMGKVNVFFCGPTKMASNIKAKCVQYQFTFCKEVF